MRVPVYGLLPGTPKCTPVFKNPSKDQLARSNDKLGLETPLSSFYFSCSIAPGLVGVERGATYFFGSHFYPVQ